MAQCIKFVFSFFIWHKFPTQSDMDGWIAGQSSLRDDRLLSVRINFDTILFFNCQKIHTLIEAF